MLQRFSLARRVDPLAHESLLEGSVVRDVDLHRARVSSGRAESLVGSTTDLITFNVERWPLRGHLPL